MISHAVVPRSVPVAVKCCRQDDGVQFKSGNGFYSGPIERLGIPGLTMEDGPAGVRINRGDVHEGRATAMPAPIALAATWDVELAEECGDVLGTEAFATGHNIQLAPAVDIARVAIGGRTFESFGEDPLLQELMAVPLIRAIQAYRSRRDLSGVRLDGHALSSVTIGERRRRLPSQWAVCGSPISPTKVPSWASWRKARNIQFDRFVDRWMSRPT